MEDLKILSLYWNRNPDAIQEASAKYGKYCTSIAKNILGNDEDAEECVNDAQLRAWNSIPPQRPESLSAYLGKITRNLAFDRYRYRQAGKRGGGEIDGVLSELEDCISDGSSVEQELDKTLLTEAINAFLDTLSQKKRNLFLQRYWYAQSIPEIAKKNKMTEGNVSVTLSRIRNKLREYLEEGEFEK